MTELGHASDPASTKRWRIPAILVAVAAILLIAGWSWFRMLYPPYHWKAVLFFSQHKEALDAAADWIEAEGIDDVSVLPEESVWAQAAGIMAERHDEPALRHAGVLEHAVRTSRGVRFNPGSFAWGDHDFVVAAVRLMDPDRAAPTCHHQWDRNDGGICAYQLAERWYLEYWWILADQE